MNSWESKRQTIYCIPGLGASKTIFEFLPKHEQFNYVLLNQKFPNKGETFESYIQRWSKDLVEDHPILIGVSFGGIIAQELSKYKPIKKIILISSVRSPKDYYFFMKAFKYLKLHKILLGVLLSKLRTIENNPKSDKQHKMSIMLKRYLPYRESHYIKWSADQIINWKPNACSTPLVQIHGTKDEVFPYAKTKNAISIKDGTHAMIITKRKWFEENLLNYLLD